MRKEYGSALRRLFKQQLKICNTGLMEYSPPKDLIFPGERAYRLLIDSLTCVVILKPHPMGQEFTIEIGWSESNEFPLVDIRPSGFLSRNKTEFKKADFVLRIGDLLDRNDFWWQIEEAPQSVDDIMRSMEKLSKEEAEANVMPHVQDAVQKVIEYILPFFEELAAFKGV